METIERRCPECGSSNTFETKHKTKWFWWGVCRDCWHKAILCDFYLTPIERLYKREGFNMFVELLKAETKQQGDVAE